MSRKIADFVHRLCAGPDLSDLRDMDPSTVRNSRFQSEGISVALTSWELKALSKSWRALVAQQSVGLVLFAALFDKYPMSRAVFGLKGSNKEFALADYRVKRQALIIEDTIGLSFDRY
uniref:Uncharacterized protein n=1 Tax=Plectus sambesii TaxID=2011161 RepID=A0A914UQU6_9BILA